MIFAKECVMLSEEAGDSMSIVTFCGHNEVGIGEETRQMLYRAVEQEIQNGADLFYLGGSGQIVEYARKREARGLIVVTNLARLEKPDAP